MKHFVHNDHCANPQHAGPGNSPRRPNIFAAKAAAFMLTFSYACSMFSAQEPSAPARTARISSEQGTVGKWLFRRGGASSLVFENPMMGTYVLVGGSGIVVRRYSLSQGREVESSFPLGELSPGSIGASSRGDSLLITVQNNLGKVFQITVPPGGENPELRTFVRSR